MCIMFLSEFNFVFAFVRQIKAVEKSLLGDNSLLTLQQKKSKMCQNFSNKKEYFMTNILILERRIQITRRKGKKSWYSLFLKLSCIFRRLLILVYVSDIIYINTPNSLLSIVLPYLKKNMIKLFTKPLLRANQ